MQTLYILDTSDTRIKIIDEKLKAKGELTADILNDTYDDDYKRVYVLSPRFQDNNPEFTGFAVNSTVFFFSLSDKTLDLLAHKNCKVVNITDNERFTCINSKLTAEGALYYALQKSDVSLKERKVLIIGFGHLGKALLTTFLPHCPHLCVASRRELTRCETRQAYANKQKYNYPRTRKQSVSVRLRGTQTAEYRLRNTEIATVKNFPRIRRERSA